MILGGFSTTMEQDYDVLNIEEPSWSHKLKKKKKKLTCRKGLLILVHPVAGRVAGPAWPPAGLAGRLAGRRTLN